MLKYSASVDGASLRGPKRATGCQTSASYLVRGMCVECCWSGCSATNSCSVMLARSSLDEAMVVPRAGRGWRQGEMLRPGMGPGSAGLGRREGSSPGERRSWGFVGGMKTQRVAERGVLLAVPRRAQGGPMRAGRRVAAQGAGSVPPTRRARPGAARWRVAEVSSKGSGTSRLQKIEVSRDGGAVRGPRPAAGGSRAGLGIGVLTLHRK